MKKIMIALLVSLLVLSGCQKNDEGSTDEIVVWAMGDEAKEMDNMAAKFTEESGISVKVQAIPWGNAHEKLLTAVSSKSGPDVVQMGTTWMPEFQEAGALAKLDDYINESEILKPENFFEGSVETTEFDGSYYGIPWATETRVLFYRTDLLASVGYDKAPETWDELMDAAVKLSKRGDDMYGINIDAKEQSLSFTFARQNDSELFDESGKPLFNEAPFVEAVSYLNEFIQVGAAPKTDLALELAQTFGGEGMVPMFISGPWMIKIIQDTIEDIDGKWATAVLPKKANNVSSLGGSNLSVFEYSKNKDNAIKFIEFMSKESTQLEWLEMTNALPTVKAAWEKGSLHDDELYKVFGDQLENARPMPLIPEFEQIAQKYLEHFEQIYLGGADVQAEMDKLVEESLELLK